MDRKIILFLTFTSAIALMSGAALQAAPESHSTDKEETTITFKGCSIIRRSFMSEAALQYSKITGKKVNVMGGGATLGIRATAAGDADIGGTCRPCLPDRFDEEKGVYLIHVAWDALVFITHTSNAANNIDLQQAKDVLLGKITNWQDLGGPCKPLVSVFRAQIPLLGGKASGVEFMARLMLFNNPDIDFREESLTNKDSSEVEETIEKIPYSFGVTGYCSARKRNVMILNLDGIIPTPKAIASGQYPLFRPLYLVSKGRPAGQVKEFIDWLLSKEGQIIVSEQGAVTLTEGKNLVTKFKFWKNTDTIINYDKEVIKN